MTVRTHGIFGHMKIWHQESCRLFAQMTACFTKAWLRKQDMSPPRMHSHSGKPCSLHFPGGEVRENPISDVPARPWKTNLHITMHWKLDIACRMANFFNNAMPPNTRLWMIFLCKFVWKLCPHVLPWKHWAAASRQARHQAWT